MHGLALANVYHRTILKRLCADVELFDVE